MDFRPHLISLLDYTERMATVGERAIFRLAEYRSLIFHEYELNNRVGIFHDVAEDEERTWLKIDRLRRKDPPHIPEEIADWITVGRDPFKQPIVRDTRVITVKREEAEALIESGHAKREDTIPAMRRPTEAPAAELCDVILRLDNNLDAQARVRAYLEGAWIEWAEEEKPRRETIRIYDAFFSLQQAIEVQGLERSFEVAWGVGVARWRHPKQEIDHPLLEQLVELDIDPEDGAIRVRPRSAEPTVAVKAYHELEVGGADTFQRFAREYFKQFGPENEFSPFSNSSFEPVLRQASSLLDAEGRYHPDHIEDVNDRSVPTADITLTVTDTWAIYARPRSANIVVEDIGRLKENIAKSEPNELPGTARRLVSHPDDNAPAELPHLPTQLGTGLAQKLRGASTTNLGEESTYYFPKPFNDEQVEIVKRLARDDGVVVQGPPGTGKTHTIANIICHYMATGRRVLVVSHGEAALGVLRDQIPAEIRELAIALLTSERQGLKQLEGAVRLLADDLSQKSPALLARSIDEGETRIIALKEKIASIDIELRRWAMLHLTRLSGDDLKRLGGSDGVLPIELAKHVVEGRIHHGWFTDGATIKEPPQFDDTDIARLRNARKALQANLSYVGVPLPSPSDLPDAVTLAAIHEDLVRASEIEAMTRAGELPPLSLTVDNALLRAESLIGLIDDLIIALEARASTPWLEEIFDLAREGDARPESEILKRVQGLLAEAAEGLRPFIAVQVEVPEAVFGDEQILEDIREALVRQASGRSAFAAISFGQSDVKKFHGKVRHDGRPVTSAESARYVLNYIAWRDTVKELHRRWNQLARQIKIPQLKADIEYLGRSVPKLRTMIAVQVSAAPYHSLFGSRIL
jgi:hypothetical protein